MRVSFRVPSTLSGGHVRPSLADFRNGRKQIDGCPLFQDKPVHPRRHRLLHRDRVVMHAEDDDSRSRIAFLEQPRHIPFPAARSSYLNTIPTIELSTRLLDLGPLVAGESLPDRQEASAMLPICFARNRLLSGSMSSGGVWYLPGRAGNRCDPWSDVGQRRPCVMVTQDDTSRS